MAGIFTHPIGRTVDGGDAEDAIDELKNAIVQRTSFGTAAPDSKTQGAFYFQIGASQTDAVKVFVKVNGVWYGG